MSEPKSRRAWYFELHFQILIALVLSLTTVSVLRGVGVTHSDAPVFMEILSTTGEIFLRLLKMIIVPLVFASVITGMMSVGSTSSLSKLGFRTVAYYMGTTALAVAVGLVVVNVIQPGEGAASHLGDLLSSAKEPTIKPSALSEVLLGIVPQNPFAALAKTDLLSVIFVSILVGLGVVAVGEPARPFAKVIEGFNHVVEKVTGWVMQLAPLGVYALLTAVLMKTGLSLLIDLGWYMAAVVIGLGVHGAFTLGGILWLAAGRNPFRFAMHMMPSILTSFSTASSSATLPVTMECVTENAGQRKDTASFVLPVGATINMDGTALYESIAAVFIAQLYDIELSFADQLIIFLTSTLAAVGAAGVPSAGLVTMIIVLRSVGLPLEGIAIIAGVDRLLDMCRTTVNVWGDSVGVAVVDRWLGHKPGDEGPDSAGDDARSNADAGS